MWALNSSGVFARRVQHLPKNGATARTVCFDSASRMGSWNICIMSYMIYICLRLEKASSLPGWSQDQILTRKSSAKMLGLGVANHLLRGRVLRSLQRDLLVHPKCKKYRMMGFCWTWWCHNIGFFYVFDHPLLREQHIFPESETNQTSRLRLRGKGFTLWKRVPANNFLLPLSMKVVNMRVIFLQTFKCRKYHSSLRKLLHLLYIHFVSPNCSMYHVIHGWFLVNNKYLCVYTLHIII